MISASESIRAAAAAPVLHIGRYTLLRQLAAGGMGVVYLAKFHGEAGFSRLLAVKRLHSQFARDPDFLCMFLDEARIASRIRHPHVVSVIDVVSNQGELLLVMDYVLGLPLSKILRLVGSAGVAPEIAVAIAGGMLQGLHAAHEAKNDRGAFLNLVHRDVSPQNLMIAEDGTARVVDFGVASAIARLQSTADGQVKGKLAYMSPEQVDGAPLDRRSDLFSAAIVLWEMLTGARFSDGEVGEKVGFLLRGKFKKPSEVKPGLPRALDEVVHKALSRDPNDRYPTAEAMMDAMYAAVPPAHDHEVRTWLKQSAGPLLDDVAKQAQAAEALTEVLPATRSSVGSQPRAAAPPELEERTLLADPHEGKKSRKAVYVSVALLLLLAFFAWLFYSYNRGASGPIGTQAPANNVPQKPGSAGANEGVSDATQKGNSEAPPSPEKAAPAAADEEAEKPAAAETESVKAAPRPATRPKTDPCKPPYVLLKGGLKRYKPECL